MARRRARGSLTDWILEVRGIEAMSTETVAPASGSGSTARASAHPGQPGTPLLGPPRPAVLGHDIGDLGLQARLGHNDLRHGPVQNKRPAPDNRLGCLAATQQVAPICPLATSLAGSNTSTPSRWTAARNCAPVSIGTSGVAGAAGIGGTDVCVLGCGPVPRRRRRGTPPHTSTACQRNSQRSGRRGRLSPDHYLRVFTGIAANRVPHPAVAEACGIPTLAVHFVAVASDR